MATASSMQQPALLLLRQLTQDPVTASLLAVALATAVLMIAALSRGGGRKPRLPPSPRGFPVIGHLHLVRPPVHRTFHDLAARLGPLMHIRLGSTHCVVASSAGVAAELIRTHEGKISERPLTAVARQFAYGDDGFAFAPYGPHWRSMKRLCMSELLGPRTVEQLRPVRRAGLVSLLQSVLHQASGAEAVDLTAALIRLSNTSIIRMMASTVPGSVTGEAQALVKAVAELVGAFNVEDYIAVCRGWDLQGLGRRAADVHRRFDALLEQMIRHKEEAREARKMRGGAEGETPEKKTATGTTTESSKDLLDILLDKLEDDAAAEVKLTRKKIKAFVIVRPKIWINLLLRAVAFIEFFSIMHVGWIDVGRGDRRLRHVGGHGGVDAGGADEPPGVPPQGAGGDRRGGGARQDRGRGRRGEPPLPAGGVQGDAPTAPGGPDRAPAVDGGDGGDRGRRRRRVHGACGHGGVHEPVVHRARPGQLGRATGVPA
uniref:Uncharacterized protein n=1 Tax=Aegilops tauschii subsp. strangulata TaxID=200361 RepID=A0A453ACT7_AEGTS